MVDGVYQDIFEFLKPGSARATSSRSRINALFEMGSEFVEADQLDRRRADAARTRTCSRTG
jgi:hypothetical protein